MRKVSFSAQRVRMVLLGVSVLGAGLILAATAGASGAPTVAPESVVLCVKLGHNGAPGPGTFRVIRTVHPDLQWSNGKNPANCAKEDEQRVLWPQGATGPTGATGT
jgi:hypothetical protein